MSLKECMTTWQKENRKPIKQELIKAKYLKPGRELRNVQNNSWVIWSHAEGTVPRRLVVLSCPSSCCPPVNAKEINQWEWFTLTCSFCWYRVKQREDRAALDNLKKKLLSSWHLIAKSPETKALTSQGWQNEVHYKTCCFISFSMRYLKFKSNEPSFKY